MRPCKRFSHFENCHFLSHRPLDFLKSENPQTLAKFTLGNQPFCTTSPPNFSCNHQHRPIKKRLKKMCTLQTLFPPLNIAIFRRLAPSCSFLSEYKSRPRGILCVDTIGSPHRGILYVDKIGSVAPELHG